VKFVNVDVQDGTHPHFSGKGVILNAELTVDQVNFGSFW
jgi:ribosomal protein L31